MFVIKRNGKKEAVDLNKISKRITYLVNEPYPLTHINPIELAITVIGGVINNITTSEIDIHAASLAASLGTRHREYIVLAGRIAVDNHHKNTLNSVADKVSLCYLNKDNSGNSASIISHNFNKFVNINKVAIDSAIDYSRDFMFDYFGFKTLEKGYLIALKGESVERPQDLFMRVAIQVWMPTDIEKLRDKDCLEKIFHTYDMMSKGYYTHATPTLFNSGGIRPNLSSCFLLSSEDSIEGIMKTLTSCVTISKWSGGIGLDVSDWRGKDALIRGTNGLSGGIIPFLRMFNDGARAFDQGGKRKGSFAIYLEPHHPDIREFLDLKLAGGDENLRCRDLFLALWISDLFMERVKSNGKWSTFCPDACPGLNKVYGEEYKNLYMKYESEGKSYETFDAMTIWNAIYQSHKESGIPYMCYKDNVNRVNMQNNLGVINSSNLCSEIILFSSISETSTCNLSSICLPRFVEDSYSLEELEIAEDVRRKLNHEFPLHPKMNWKLLAEVAAEITDNLNQVIDKTFSPTVEAARSNFKHRPIGIGIQGLADMFLKFGVAFDSQEARDLNKRVSEAIYYGSLSKSAEICRNTYLSIMKNFDEENGYTAKIFTKKALSLYPALADEDVFAHYKTKKDVPKTVGSYSSYTTNGGSHLCNGKFHWEMSGLTEKDLSGLFDWDTLRDIIKIFGVRNSTTTAYMPTGTTSQIMGCSPCIEPYVSNIYKRTTLAGNFSVVNKYLVKYLHDSGLYDPTLNNYLMEANGSIQNIAGIPDHIKALYKTAWEIKQKAIVQLAIDRQPFIDQSQSMNLFFEKYTIDTFTATQFYGWKNGLKTGSYYVRTREAVMPQKFTVSLDIQKEMALADILRTEKSNETLLKEEEVTCISCGS